MKYTYEEIVSGIETNILRSDGAIIPKNEANSDYQKYLAAQSTPSL
jgi:hypothetical protein